MNAQPHPTLERLSPMHAPVRPVVEAWSPNDALLVFLTVAVPALVVLALAMTSAT